MALSPNFIELELILSNILNSNNNIRKESENKLTLYYNNPNEYINLLMEIFNISNNINSKLLAGVLLRQQIDAQDLCWDKCSNEIKFYVRNNLLNLLNNLHNIDKVLRRNVIEAIGSLAVKALPKSINYKNIIIFYFIFR